jgi:hypothetical protein
VDKRLADKQAAAEVHRKQMETLKDPEQLTTAMRQHFQMTEEILALMLERRKLLTAQAPTSAPPAAAPSPSSPGQGMSGGMGGMMEHGRGMMQKEMGGMQGGGMPGGGMQSGSPQGSGAQGGTTMQGGMSGMPGGGTQSSQTTPGSDTEQMMQRLAEHSAYMETLQDKAAVAQEMLRHQKMLDQMLQLMQ